MVENAAKNKYLHAFLSQVDDSVIEKVLENVNLQGSTVLPDIMAYAMVLENLNLEMIKDYKFVEVCYDIWRKDELRQFLTGFEAIKTSSIETAVAIYIGIFKANKISAAANL